MKQLFAELLLVLIILAGAAAWLLPSAEPTPAISTFSRSPEVTLIQSDWASSAWAFSKVALAALPGVLVVGLGLAMLASPFLLWTRQRQKHEVDLMRARREAPEHVTNYSPRLSLNAGSTRYPNIVREDAPALPALDVTPMADAPTLSTLLDRGLISRDQPLILGYTNGTPLTGSWRDIYSAAIAGVSGSGKTTTERFLACQAALQGAQFAVIDPHMESGEESLAATLAPLSAAMLCEPVSNERDIFDVLRLVQSHLQARLNGDSDRTPIVLAVDELTRLARNERASTTIGNVIEDIAQQGRKVGVFCLLAGQIWRHDRAMGTPLRDSLASCYVHRMKKAQARLLVPTEESRLVEDLAPGQALLLRTNGDCATVAIPLATAADVERVGAMLATSAQPERKAIESQRTPKEAQVIAMLQGGATVPDVVKALYGTTGAAYTAGVKEVSSIISQELRQRQV